MSMEDEDDKPTVVLDLNALKKQALKSHEDLTSAGKNLNDLMAGEGIEFNVASDGPMEEVAVEAPQSLFTVVLFDFQSDFFNTNIESMPLGFDYMIATNLQELNTAITPKEFKLLVFNYDENPKVANQLLAQIKKKFPHIKTLIMAKNISPEKAKLHAQSASGANGYYQMPLDTEKIKAQFMRIFEGSTKRANT